jgi:hypothetical protein
LTYKPWFGPLELDIAHNVSIGVLIIEGGAIYVEPFSLLAAEPIRVLIISQWHYD